MKVRLVFGVLALMSLVLTTITQSPIAGILTGMLISGALLLRSKP